ncbi:hypothetical protein [Rhodohalobacter sulfatireducens]|uniref:Type II secretion system protein n=1 Tax=Rhodohalobacter sulfatireducens TaxID=2911366 RepID=A0ABS9KI52_9BACT|nr:hypothetical protein [Rhodohalobacter sulfatireducens]MCG2590519.1 hypothetical protein [Rhodohalobacter sulfatireducens]
MGQQQLLLVILVTIIVGIATVVAINIFGTAADQANLDAVRQDLMAAGVQAQAIWARPGMMDGANRDFTGGAENAEDIDASTILRQLNIPGEFDSPTDPTTVTNENGLYRLGTIQESSLEIVAVPASGADEEEQTVHAVTCRDDQGNWQIDIEQGEVPAPCG